MQPNSITFRSPRRSVSRALLAGTAGCVLGAAGLSGVGTSAADTGARTRDAAPDPRNTISAVAVTAPLSQEVRAIVDRRDLSISAALAEYWTSDRMRTALPADMPVHRSPTGSSGASPPSTETGPGSRTGQSVASAAPRSAGAMRGWRNLAEGTHSGRARAALVNASPTIGKVFYRNATDNKNYVCSGGTVNSKSKRLIITAGHCVHGGKGRTWHQNWVFVPGYNKGGRPIGTWSAERLATVNAWVSNSDLNHDAAFVKMYDLNGRHIVDQVGGNGLQTGQPMSRFMTILGYPAEPPYPGDVQYYCTGNTSPSGSRIQMACPFTGGASGSPWLWNYSDATMRGQINGIASTNNPTHTTVWSPYFGDAVWDLYNHAEGL